MGFTRSETAGRGRPHRPRERPVAAAIRRTRRLCVAAVVLGALGSAPAARGDEYVVRLDPGLDPAQRAAADAARFGGTVEFVYRSALRGYAVDVAPERVAELAAANGVVAV